MSLLRSRPALSVFWVAYTAVLMALLPEKPLWVDEIIDLGGVRNADLRGVLEFVPQNAGGVPLGYLTDFAMIRWFGYSVFLVRLPSVFFGVLACAGVWNLARQTGLSSPLLAAVLYASSPLVLRYNLEARPYAQAACWSVVSTVAFLRLVRRPAFAKAAVYAALITAGLYTQPYSVFIVVAHLVWLVLTRNFCALPVAGGAAATAGLAFLPFFLKTHAAWQGMVTSGARFTVSFRDLAVIPHELTGAGYAGAALTVITIFVTLAGSPLKKSDKLLWTLCATLPVILVPAADASFGYFLAARQMIFALAPISILVAACADIRRWGFVLPVVLLAAMLYEDVRWIRRPGEGWESAAAQLTQPMSEPGSCAMFVPSGARTMYVYFQPQIRACDEGALAGASAVALALNPDQPPAEIAAARERLERAGLQKTTDLRAENPRIELYRRPAR